MVSEKDYHEMDDVELRQALNSWERHVENAAGWPSAYFAAKQVAAIVEIGNQRGLGMVNNHPIKVG